ncbi:MAG: hypothetical protein C0418_01375 [Coriobacteriaceae bacterium]|nr:hypothetical protein [Coriobacteriaceae bacterium]
MTAPLTSGGRRRSGRRLEGCIPLPHTGRPTRRLPAVCDTPGHARHPPRIPARHMRGREGRGGPARARPGARHGHPRRAARLRPLDLHVPALACAARHAARRLLRGGCRARRHARLARGRQGDGIARRGLLLLRRPARQGHVGPRGVLARRGRTHLRRLRRGRDPHVTESVVAWAQSLPPVLKYVVLTLVPWVELRGAIPLAIQQGERLYLPVILLSNTLIFWPTYYGLEWLYRFIPEGAWLHRKLERIREKAHPLVEKYGMLGLAVFVAIPLPGTGAYSGSCAGWLLDLDPRHAFLAVTLGVVGAFLIVWGATELVAAGFALF